MMMRHCGVLVIMASLAGLAGTPAAAQRIGVAALVVAVDGGAGRADAVQGGFEALGAETLRADDPNNAEMRSLLMRFADVAENRDAALIYLDAPVARYGRRDFVLPSDAQLPEANDLLTRALPLSAFARAAAVAGNGGAVFVAASARRTALPEGVEAARDAPEDRIGMTPVVLATGAEVREMVQALATLDRSERVELGALMARMTERPGTTASTMPAAPVYLGDPPGASAPLAEPDSGADAATALAAPAGAGPDAASASADPYVESLTPEALAALEQALSRSAKRRIQLGLRARGHYSGLIDGIIGQQTRQAIRAYQEAEGLEPTGYLTERRLLSLQQP